MDTQLIHTYHSHLDLSFKGQPLFRYVYQPTTPAFESPKPYFHPLYTLDGNLVTNFRPHDHLWHHGLAMTMAVLSNENFWGGASYVHGEGYVPLPNNGQMAHQRWDEIVVDADNIRFSESLTWISYAGESWLNEKRVFEVSEINAEAGYWTLDFTTSLTNTRGEDLVFGSPTTKGRPMAGYGSLFWRGPRSFYMGDVLAAGGLEGPDVMGQPAAWLAFNGKHDGTGDTSTLIFIDQPENPRYPNKWFIRAVPFAAVSYSFMFDEEYVLPPEDTLRLHYQLVIANGTWSRDEIERLVA